MNFKEDLEYLKNEKTQLTVDTASSQCAGIITAYNDTHIMLVQSSRKYSAFEECWIESGVKSLIPINKIESIVYQFSKQAP